ncbi:MAG: hypothetical protein IPK93_02680 [Solirubrobacterales bacterium]|nr:hypothetical protein [Solirubrobacterales bacterium]
MPSYRARSNAFTVAEYVYTDPDMTWDDYGVRTCRRSSRSKVSCYSYVSEDLYDDYGYYLDTVLCDWFTASAYLRSGRMKVWTYSRECVLLSEV